MNPTTYASSLILPAYFQGLALSLGLIVAIGAQNAFVLRQGLRREHVAPIVMFCAASDALLITAGVMGMGEVLGDSPLLSRMLALAGAAFLAVYGWRALARARRPGALVTDAGGIRLTRGAALAQAAAFTLLNPHVYLDTMLLVGGIGAQQPAGLRGWFVTGAGTASVLWFTTLGFGSRWLSPLFAKPGAWRALDTGIGVMMFVLAALMLGHVIGGYPR